nr:MAG TPA: hypothetical protein [Caudoviricetes sp.]
MSQPLRGIRFLWRKFYIVVARTSAALAAGGSRSYTRLKTDHL